MKELVRKCFLQKTFETDKYQRALEQREGMIVVLEKEKDILLEMVRQKRIEVRELKLTQEEKDKEIAHIRIDLEARLNDYNSPKKLVNLRMSEILPSVMNESVNTKVRSDYDPLITKKQDIEKSKVFKPPTSSHSSDISNLETIQELIEVSDSEGDGAEDDYSEDEEETQGGADKENDLEERVGQEDNDTTSSKRQEDPSNRRGGDGDGEGNGREEVADGDKTQILIEQVEELLTSTNSLTSSQNGKQKDNLLFDLQRRILEDDSGNEKSAEEEEGDVEEEDEEREERVDSPGSEEEEGRGGSEESCAEDENDVNKDQAGANVIRLSDKMFNKLEKVELTKALVSNVLTEAHSSDNKQDVKTKHERGVSLKKEAKSIPSVTLPVDETKGRSYQIPSSSSEEEGTPIKRKSYDFELYRGAIEEDVVDKTKEIEIAKEQPAVLLKSNSVERVEEPADESSRALVLYDAEAVSGPPPAKKRKRQGKGCGECSGCLVTEDCDKCKHCLDKPRNGGKNTLRQKCMEKRCTA